MSHFLPLSGVSAVEPEWIPKLLPQYCHFGSPQEVPPPWFCSSTGTIKCHRPSTFCRFSKDKQHVEKCVCLLLCKCCYISPAVRVGWQLPAVETEYPDGLERYKLFSRLLLEGQVLQQNWHSYLNNYWASFLLLFQLRKSWNNGASIWPNLNGTLSLV